MAGFQEPPSKKVKKDDSFNGSGSTGHIAVQQIVNGISPYNGNNKSKNGNDYSSFNQNGVPSGIKNTDHLKGLNKQRRSLPIFPVRGKLLEELKKNETVIIIGETGSGKTTQIPQYIHEERWDRSGMICVSQPRRVAAVTVAKRVAEEMGTNIGGLVGYTVRFEDTCNTGVTKLKYATDGMLLREAISDPTLMKYAWVILDEAHERTISTDVLFGVVKAAQKKRKSEGREPLKIIV
ncbi:unnamed protein product, partial [Meganyctiphanes norvegica]